MHFNDAKYSHYILLLNQKMLSLLGGFLSYAMHHQRKKSNQIKTKQMAHDSPIVRAKENLQLCGGGPSLKIRHQPTDERLASGSSLSLDKCVLLKDTTY